MRFVYLAVLALTGLFGLMAGPSNAQATRTWVSGVGDDVNPCSRTAPCKTFAGAISKTATGGEINTLDPAGYGTVTITKSITIRSDHVQGSILASGTNGININLPNATDKVVLDGLDINGAGTTLGTNGIRMIGPGRVFIIRCSIRNFSGNGVTMQAPAASPAPRFLIKDSVIINTGTGVNVLGTSGAVNNGEILNTLIDNNTTAGLQVGPGGIVVLSNSTLTGGPSGTAITGNGQILSYGDNVIRNGTATLTPQALQ